PHMADGGLTCRSPIPSLLTGTMTVTSPTWARTSPPMCWHCTGGWGCRQHTTAWRHPAQPKSRFVISIRPTRRKSTRCSRDRWCASRVMMAAPFARTSSGTSPTSNHSRAIIHAADASWQFAQHIIRLPPQVNARADEVIEQILDRMPLRRAKLKGYWVLGKLNHSELATNTRLPIATIPRSLETGQSTFTYIGDTWGDGVPADAAIRQMAESER